MVLTKTRKYNNLKYNNLKYNIKKHTRRKDKHKTGGEAIAAGGYGCVFKPVLRCEQMKRNNKRGKILVSKLLMKEDAFDEMEEIEGILKFIKKNPDNSKYFIINDQVSICKPAPLTKTDLHNYDKVCSGTKVGRNGINSTNINENLDKLNIINQIDGGKDLDVYIQTHYYYKKLNKSERIIEFRKLNTSLINLLNNAIVKINNDGLYHFDIKGSNILVGKDGNTRLIDWGASFVYFPNAANAANAANAYKANTPSSKSIIHSKYNIPQKVFNRSMFQFNIPFSIILFFDNIDNVLLQIQEKSEKSDNSYDLAQKIILLSLKDAGEGHFDLILEYMINIYNYGNKNKFTKRDALKVIIEYISNVLLNFLDFSTFQFNLEKFFNDVVKHNIDVYGFLMSYIDFILYSKSIGKSMKSKNNNEEEEIYKKLAEIIIEFCFESKYASKRIPVKTLTTKLKML
jgi:serine/threonine protein kinase